MHIIYVCVSMCVHMYVYIEECDIRKWSNIGLEISSSIRATDRNLNFKLKLINFN